MIRALLIASLACALMGAPIVLAQAHPTVRPVAAQGSVGENSVPLPMAQGAQGTSGQTGAQANAAVRGEVIIVLASEAAGPTDPALASVPELRQPAFSGFHSMRLLSRPALSLAVGRPTEIALPNGRRLQLIVEERRPDGRYRVRVSINRPTQTDYLPVLTAVASPGAPFFVAGQSYQGGTLVIGVRIGESSPLRGIRLPPGGLKAAKIQNLLPGQPPGPTP